MENIDLLVLRSAQNWLAEGHSVMIATVARTWGSSPRPVGSMMALRNDGRVVGSVSGGCIEDDLIDCYTQANGGEGMIAKTPEVTRYGERNKAVGELNSTPTCSRIRVFRSISKGLKQINLQAPDS